MSTPSLSATSAYSFEALSDHSGALPSDINQPLIEYRMKGAFDTVKSIKTGSMKKIESVVKPLQDGELGLLMLNGHGNTRSIHFGDSLTFGALTVDNVHLYKHVFEKVHPQGLIFVKACSDGKNELAKKIHELTGRRVCAVEDSYCYSEKSYLIRNEITGLFEMHYFDPRGNDVTVLYEDGKKKTFRSKSKEILRWVLNQGYDFDAISTDKLKLFAANSNRAIFPCRIAEKLIDEKKDLVEARKYLGRAFELASENRSTPEIFNMIQTLERLIPTNPKTQAEHEWKHFLINMIKDLYGVLEIIPSIQSYGYLLTKYTEGTRHIPPDYSKLIKIQKLYRNFTPPTNVDELLKKLERFELTLATARTEEILQVLTDCELSHAELWGMRNKTPEYLEVMDILQEHIKNYQSQLILRKEESLRLLEPIICRLHGPTSDLAEKFARSKKKNSQRLTEEDYYEGVKMVDAYRDAALRLRRLLQESISSS